jgi:hypothetical protein
MDNDDDFSISNFELINLFKKYKMNLNQICSKDQLIGIPKQGNYIINMADENHPVGTHWVCFVIRGKECMYFDSFGEIFPPDVKKFITKNKSIKLFYNADHIQHLDSTTCGFYCLSFCYYVHKHPKDNLRYLLNMYNSQFSEDTKNNDKILQKIIVNIK